MMAYLGTFDFDAIVQLYDIKSNTSIVVGLLQGVLSIGGGIGALSASIVLKIFSRRYIFVKLEIAYFWQMLSSS